MLLGSGAWAVRIRVGVKPAKLPYVPSEFSYQRRCRSILQENRSGGGLACDVAEPIGPARHVVRNRRVWRR